MQPLVQSRHQFSFRLFFCFCLFCELREFIKGNLTGVNHSFHVHDFYGAAVCISFDSSVILDFYGVLTSTANLFAIS